MPAMRSFLLAAALVLAAAPSAAQTAPGRTARRPYALNPLLDVASIAAAGSLWLGPEFMHHELVPLGRCPCDPYQLNDLDRPFAGINVPNVAVPSNVATGLLVTAPLIFDIFDVWRSGGSFPEYVEDTLVMGEALVVGGALNELVKLTFQRPRPGLYGIDPSDSRLTDPESYMSFYSLAAAEVFTVMTAGAVTFALRHPRSPWRWVYIASAGVLASGFGISRFLLGKHFPTDVLAAAGVGTLVGLAIPLLHERRVPVTLGAGAIPGGAMITATVITR